MKNVLLYLVKAAVVFVAPLQAETLLLTGEIQAAKQQVVAAPRTANWRIQIQWMAPEGKIVNQGDLIAVFDGSGTQNQIEQDKEQLSGLLLEKQQLTVTKQQEVDEAMGALKVANLEVEKASYEARVTTDDVSKYDRGLYQITLERAIFEQLKAQQTLTLKQQEKASQIEQKELEIQRLQRRLEYFGGMLDKLSVKAEFSGPVTHYSHPWTRDKVTPGATLEPSMRVLNVQALSQYQVEAWVHEMDLAKLNRIKSVEMTFDAFPTDVFSGEIITISSQGEERNRWGDGLYHRVHVGFQRQPSLALKPGMSLRLEIGLQEPQMAAMNNE